MTSGRTTSREKCRMRHFTQRGVRELLLSDWINVFPGIGRVLLPPPRAWPGLDSSFRSIFIYRATQLHLHHASSCRTSRKAPRVALPAKDGSRSVRPPACRCRLRLRARTVTSRVVAQPQPRLSEGQRDKAEHSAEVTTMRSPGDDNCIATAAWPMAADVIVGETGPCFRMGKRAGGGGHASPRPVQRGWQRSLCSSRFGDYAHVYSTHAGVYA